MKKIDLIILAAGKSSRFGSLKGFAKYKGKALLESAINLHEKNFYGNTFVIYSRDSMEYKKTLQYKYPKVIFVENKTPEHGPFSSLQAGVERVLANHFFVLPVDCPARNEKTWLQLC